MAEVISVIFLTASLLNILVFGGSLASSLTVAVLSAGLLGFRLSYGRRFGKTVNCLVSVPAVTIFITLSFAGGMQQTGTGLLYYDSLAAEVSGLIENKEYYKASGVISEIEQAYGINDTILLFKARADIGLENSASAGRALSEVDDMKSPEFYKVLGFYYYIVGDYARIRDTFDKAATIYPFWTDAQLIAGSQTAADTKSLINSIYDDGTSHIKVNAEAAEHASNQLIGRQNVIRFQKVGYPGLFEIISLYGVNTDGNYIRMAVPRDAAAASRYGGGAAFTASRAFAVLNIYFCSEIKGYSAEQLAYIAAGIIRENFGGYRFLDWASSRDDIITE